MLLNFRLFQHKLVVEQEMLYYSSVVMGQSLMKNMQGKNEIRRDALVCFVNACRWVDYYFKLLSFVFCGPRLLFVRFRTKNGFQNCWCLKKVLQLWHKLSIGIF